VISGTDSFSYYVTDGESNSNTVTVDVNVEPKTLVANPVTFKVIQGSEFTFSDQDVLANVTNPSQAPLTLTVSPPAYGSLAQDAYGNYYYTPLSGYNTDPFTYTVSNGVETEQG